MKIKIQRFSLLLFLSLSLLAGVLWSVSLYSQFTVNHLDRTVLLRSNWQLLLDRLRVQQRMDLQRDYFVIVQWLRQHADVRLQRRYLTRLSQRFAKLHWIPASAAPAANKASESGLANCAVGSAAAKERAEWPAIQVCRLHQQTLLAIPLPQTFVTAPTLSGLIAMDYFGFMDEFEKLGHKALYFKHRFGIRHYVEQSATGFASAAAPVADQNPSTSPGVLLDVREQGVTMGRISLTVSIPPFFDLWLAQAVWILPLLLLLALIGHVAVMRAIIQPLQRLTRHMQKVVRSRHPGKVQDSETLQPGLSLLKKYFMHLVHLAKHDPLTGLLNRAIFEEHLSQAILEGKRSGRKYALVLVDVNHFYKINRKYGIYLGDGVLRQLAQRLSQGLRESDSLARLEKDNFALLLDFSDEQQIIGLVEKIYQRLSQPYRVYGRDIVCGISIGVAIYPDHAQDMETLELKGNQALLQAHKGDWPVVFSRQTSEQADYSGLSQIQSLRQALDNHDFKLVYQPVVLLENHQPRYFEALLRWKQPEQHAEAIEQTIQLAEKNHLIKPLTQWIIETACQQLKRIEPYDAGLAVNLSMIDLHDEDLPARIRQSLETNGVAAERLMVEITEGQIMQEPDQVIDILNQLSVMGISSSIDDFGTGQASLTYLKRLPVEKLKIDQSFVKHMVEDEEDSAIVEATIKLAHTLGLKVVAEGVESIEIHDQLIQMGCDYVQGYYISRPLQQAAVADWLVDSIAMTPGDA